MAFCFFQLAIIVIRFFFLEMLKYFIKIFLSGLRVALFSFQTAPFVCTRISPDIKTNPSGNIAFQQRFCFVWVGRDGDTTVHLKMFIYIAGQKIDLCSDDCDELTWGPDSMSATYTELILAGCILILPFLYESSQVFRFYLKFFLYYFWVSCCSILVLPHYIFHPRDVKNLV